SQFGIADPSEEPHVRACRTSQALELCSPAGYKQSPVDSPEGFQDHIESLVGNHRSRREIEILAWDFTRRRIETCVNRGVDDVGIAAIIPLYPSPDKLRICDEVIHSPCG